MFHADTSLRNGLTFSCIIAGICYSLVTVSSSVCLSVCLSVAATEALRHVHVCTSNHEPVQCLLASVRLRNAQHAQGNSTDTVKTLSRPHLGGGVVQCLMWEIQ